MQTSTTTPIRRLSALSRSNSLSSWAPSVRRPSGSPRARESSVRLSAHLRESLLGTPPARPPAAAPPLLPTLDPGDAAEAERRARRVTRAELEAAVAGLRAENRTLQSAIGLQREDLLRLQDGLREAYEAVDQEAESITNLLIRRVDAVRRQKRRLDVQLRIEEALKIEQEARLVSLRVSRSTLARRLRREEAAEAHEEKETRAALAARLPGSSTAPRPPGAADPQALLRYIRHGVGLVEALQREAAERGDRCRRTRMKLEQRIAQAEGERSANRHSVEDIYHELTETNTCVTEMATEAEMALEANIERQIHGAYKSSGRTLSVTSSTQGSSTNKCVAPTAEKEHADRGERALHKASPTNEEKEDEEEKV